MEQTTDVKAVECFDKLSASGCNFVVVFYRFSGFRELRHDYRRHPSAGSVHGAAVVRGP